MNTTAKLGHLHALHVDVQYISYIYLHLVLCSIKRKWLVLKGVEVMVSDLLSGHMGFIKLPYNAVASQIYL